MLLIEKVYSVVFPGGVSVYGIVDWLIGLVVWCYLMILLLAFITLTVFLNENTSEMCPDHGAVYILRKLV